MTPFSVGMEGTQTTTLTLTKDGRNYIILNERLRWDPRMGGCVLLRGRGGRPTAAAGSASVTTLDRLRCGGPGLLFWVHFRLSNAGVDDRFRRDTGKKTRQKGCV